MNVNLFLKRTCNRNAFGVLVVAFGLFSTGCAREMTITQDEFVNNAMYHYRPEATAGDPLEVTIVCVYPKDLNNEYNDLLRPDSGMTCADWYQLRPALTDSVDDEGHERFRLPKNQIFLCTDDPKCYGKKIHERLRGKEKVVCDFEFSGGLHNQNSVIYVFPKFIGPGKDVLPVEPAKFDPPGAYTKDLAVHIGVDSTRNDYYGQYIEIRSQRKMHGK
ncbi:MAG: hypothetical protein ACYTHJ_17545 [Planctomycetota bacterium]